MLDWIEPWEVVEDTADLAGLRQGWESELLREVGPTHCLFGKEVKLIGRRFDTDDALFLVEGGSSVAEVHLTWSGRQETDPTWPTTVMCASLAEWMSVTRREFQQRDSE